MQATRPTRGLKHAIASHPIAVFLLILCPVSWILFLPSVLGKTGLGILSVDIPAQVGILLVTIFGLTGVAFLVTRIADGKAGTRALRSHYFRFRAGPQWYLLALAGAPILLLMASVLTRGGDALNPIMQHPSQIVTGYLLNLIVIAILISVQEEGPWMAFVTARLQRRWGPVWASIAVAPLFGFVHFPLFFLANGLTDGTAPRGFHILEYAFYLLILFSVPMRIVITWIFNSSGGSVPVVALFHASVDTTASAAVLTAFYPGIDGRLLYIGLAVVALALVIVSRGHLGYSPMSEHGQEVPAARAARVAG